MTMVASKDARVARSKEVINALESCRALPYAFLFVETAFLPFKSNVTTKTMLGASIVG